MKGYLKNGFSMIELIFIIVIIGILAAVALPKFAGMAEQAHVSNLGQFESTLNKSVSPVAWKKVVVSDKGDLKYLSNGDENLSNYVEIPKEFSSYSAKHVYSKDANLSYTKTHAYNGAGYKDILGNTIPSKCSNGNSPFALKVLGHEKTSTFRAKINGKVYRIAVCNGSSTTPPHFYIWHK